MNNEASKVFCPNGVSAAVSPLMENKCGDRLAMPSVYGRANDIVGNSIPGFSLSTLNVDNERQLDQQKSSSSQSRLSANPKVGGLPKY